MQLRLKRQEQDGNDDGRQEGSGDAAWKEQN